MVKVILSGGLGNNLFQYFTGRLIAESLDDDLECENNIFNLPNVTGAKQKQPSVIIVDGFFHKAKYFLPYREKIKGWAKEFLPEHPYLWSFVLHIRSGDLYQKWRKSKVHPEHVPCPYSYYKELLVKHRGKGTIVCERTDDPVLLKLKNEFDITVISGTPIEDFAFLMGAQYLGMSVSTFSWWAAFLSDAEMVHYPVLGFFNPEIRPDCEYYVDGYFKHELPQIINWESTPEQIEKTLL